MGSLTQLTVPGFPRQVLDCVSVFCTEKLGGHWYLQSLSELEARLVPRPELRAGTQKKLEQIFISQELGPSAKKEVTTLDPCKEKSKGWVGRGKGASLLIS